MKWRSPYQILEAMPKKHDYHTDYLEQKISAETYAKQINRMIPDILHNRKQYKNLAIKHSEFAELVREMRFNQRQYFKHSTQGFLEKSKALEKQVDQHLADITATTKQQTLF